MDPVDVVGVAGKVVAERRLALLGLSQLFLVRQRQRPDRVERQGRLDRPDELLAIKG